MNWAVRNTLKDWSLYNLSEKEVRLILMTLTSNETKMIQICDNVNKVWKRLDPLVHASLLEPLDQDHSDYPEFKHESQDDSTDTGYFVIKSKKSFHPRLHGRIEKNYKAIILGQNQNFLTSTIDLSEGGIHFFDTIPDWVSGYFIVKIEDQFSVMCCLVEDQKDKKRVQIMSEDSDPQFIKFQRWLNSLREA